MDFFWGNLFDYFKDRRYAAVFFGTLAVLFGVPIVALILCQIADSYELLHYWPFALTAFGLWLLAVIWRGCRQARARRLNRYKTSPLSRDELSKARSKLRTNTTGPGLKR